MAIATALNSQLNFALLSLFLIFDQNTSGVMDFKLFIDSCIDSLQSIYDVAIYSDSIDMIQLIWFVWFDDMVY